MSEELIIPPLPPQLQQQALKMCIHPSPGELITSFATHNTYRIGEKIGEGNFGVVYSCKDDWENDLAVKVMKPLGTYEKVKSSAMSEISKLHMLRHPNITYVFDAFEYRDTFYIVTERCFCPVADLFAMANLEGQVWLMPIARCLLQAVHYIHNNNFVHQDIHPGNVFASIIKNEMPAEATAMQFKLGDLGVAKLAHEVNAQNTRAVWLLPPEVLNPVEFGQTDYRIDIYHLGLLLLQLAFSKEFRFSEAEILSGKPREMAQTLASPLNFALEKALRRHVAYRTASAMELWRDLKGPTPMPNIAQPAL